MPGALSHPRVFGAVDLGATSGRVIAMVVTGDRIELHPVHRFPNGPVTRRGRLRWPVTRLFADVVEGLRRLADTYPSVESIGVDSWAIDYGLLREDGSLIDEPVAYRDPRSADFVEDVHLAVSPERLYELNGLQFLPFSTLYQLVAEQRMGRWKEASTVALIPDLIGYWLTGVGGTERTNASTTGLLDPSSGEWIPEILEALDLPAHRWWPLRSPGDILGPLTPDLRSRTGLGPGVVVITVASHDTASAVAAVPAASDRFAYVSSGTWSLVGVELHQPLRSPAARSANATNELGVDGRIRFLRNTGGFWLLEECLRAWRAEGEEADLAVLLAAAEALPGGGPTVDVDDAVLFPPGGMPGRIAAAAGATGRLSPAELVRCILDSLAIAYADWADRVARLAGITFDAVHLVGGGAANAFLCQQAANRSGRPVIAGPLEATAVGNALIQARATGALTGDLDQLRAVVAASVPLDRYLPQ